MHWSWLPCSGHSGGMLIGVDKNLAQVSAQDQRAFFQSVKLTMISDDFEWVLINVYGTAHDEKKLEFLEELQVKVLEIESLLIVGGDFNLVRKVEEKSSGNVDVRLVDAFNDMINTTALRELHRSGTHGLTSKTPQFCASLIEFWFPIPGKTNSIWLQF